MPLDAGKHVDAEALEQYAMGTLPEAEMACVEEHLLVCPDCQDELADVDAYLRLIRAELGGD